MKKRYMLVEYVTTPTGKIDEVSQFKNNITTRLLASATVILDLREQRIVKNSLNSYTEFQEVLDMYKGLLGNQLNQYII